MIEVKIITEGDFEAWDQFVAESATAGFFHRTGWLRAIQSAYGHTHKYLMAREHGRVVGVLPMFNISIPLIGSYLASDVFTSYGGISATSPEVSGRLLAAAKEIALSTNARYVEIKNTRDLATGNPDWHTKKSFCTLKLDIEQGAEHIWNSWPGKNRTNVRKARKSGVTVQFGRDQLSDFYKLATINMQLLGTPVHSRHFYGNILKQFPNDADIVTARLDGETIAAVLLVGYKKEMQAFASVALPQYRQLKPSALIYWDIIQRACEKGYDSLDFGRSSWESGTYQFKSQLGGKPEPLYYNYFLNLQDEVPEVHQENPRFKFAIKTWQMLPLGVTRLLGPQLIKYVA